MSAKGLHDLCETEWAVYHAAMDAEREGTTPAASVLIGRMPAYHPETVRRVRHRLARWGLIAATLIRDRRRIDRQPERYTTHEPTEQDVMEVEEAREQVLRKRLFPRIAIETSGSYILPNRTGDVLDRIARVRDDAEPAEACRLVLSVVETCGVQL